MAKVRKLIFQGVEVPVFESPSGQFLLAQRDRGIKLLRFCLLDEKALFADALCVTHHSMTYDVPTAYQNPRSLRADGVLAYEERGFWSLTWASVRALVKGVDYTEYLQLSSRPFLVSWILSRHGGFDRATRAAKVAFKWMQAEKYVLFLHVNKCYQLPVEGEE